MTVRRARAFGLARRVAVQSSRQAASVRSAAGAGEADALNWAAMASAMVMKLHLNMPTSRMVAVANLSYRRMSRAEIDIGRCCENCPEGGGG